MKCTHQYHCFSIKVGSFMGLVRMRDIKTMMTLYNFLARNHLEYSCPLWHPSSMRDIKLIRGVRRTFTSRIFGVQHLNCWERLKSIKALGLIQRIRDRNIIIQGIEMRKFCIKSAPMMLMFNLNQVIQN